jgi:head-tail adaptor
MSKTVNAGKYNKKITIYKIVQVKDKDGFPVDITEIVLTPYANVKTTKGYTIIKNNSDFEKALVNFTIRYSDTVVDAYYDSDDSNRQMFIDYKNKTFTIEYMNNIDMENHELEMQCKEVMK